jgi:predicted O-methyltransferase YrrM
MFHDIPVSIVEVMADLERRDQRDRSDGTEHLKRLRQIPRETGRFLALVAASSPEGSWLEIGTSAGYSALWLSLACHARSKELVTYEVLADKAALARSTFHDAGVDDVITLVQGDFRDHVDQLDWLSFVFLDAEKDAYADCYEAVVPHLVTGGLFVADNVISHQSELQPFVDNAMSDPRVDALVVPIGKGELVCRKR